MNHHIEQAHKAFYQFSLAPYANSVPVDEDPDVTERFMIGDYGPDFDCGVTYEFCICINRNLGAFLRIWNDSFACTADYPELFDALRVHPGPFDADSIRAILLSLGYADGYQARLQLGAL